MRCNGVVLSCVVNRPAIYLPASEFSSIPYGSSCTALYCFVCAQLGAAAFLPSLLSLAMMFVVHRLGESYHMVMGMYIFKVRGSAHSRSILPLNIVRNAVITPKLPVAHMLMVVCVYCVQLVFSIITYSAGLEATGWVIAFLLIHPACAATTFSFYNFCISDVRIITASSFRFGPP